jgi:hypothetical protein
VQEGRAERKYKEETIKTRRMKRQVNKVGNTVR